MQAAAYDLLPVDQRCDVHWHISKTLQQPQYIDNYVFDCKLRLKARQAMLT